MINLEKLDLINNPFEDYESVERALSSLPKLLDLKKRSKHSKDGKIKERDPYFTNVEINDENHDVHGIVIGGYGDKTMEKNN